MARAVALAAALTATAAATGPLPPMAPPCDYCRARIGEAGALGRRFAVGSVLTREAGVIRAKDGRLVDEDGRERIFHGVNAVYKGAPWHAPVLEGFDPTQSFSDIDMRVLRRFGVTAVRLGMMWPGVEPQRGQYNDTYLGVMSGIVSRLRDHGIYAILDWHQDGLSGKFCGEGVPLWAAQPRPDAPTFPLPLDKPYQVDKRGVPPRSECDKHGWPFYQTSAAASSAYQSLYSNRDGLRDSYAGFWRRVATEFADEPACLAYELMNEPGAGDTVQNPLLYIPGVADYVNLRPFFEEAHKQIREVDDRHMCFFAGVTWDDLYVGFTEVPGGIMYSDRNVLAYHFYRTINFDPSLIMHARALDRLRLNTASFMTEFEMGQHDEKGIEEADRTLSLAESWWQSWTGWEYKLFDPITGANNGFFPYYATGNLTVSPTVREVVSRTYAAAIAGWGKHTRYDRKTRRFELSYDANPDCKLPTTIYLNEPDHYPKGFKFTATPSGVTWERADANWIDVRAPPGYSGEVRILIKPGA